jgi:excisionase family DNA binding protein
MADRPTFPDLVTPVELAELLKVPIQTVYYWVWKKEIPFFKIGRRLRFDAHAVLKEFISRSSKAHPCLAMGADLETQPDCSLTIEDPSHAQLRRKE